MDRHTLKSVFSTAPKISAYRGRSEQPPDRRVTSPYRHIIASGGFEGLALLPGPAKTASKQREIGLIKEIWTDLDGRIPGFVLAALVSDPFYSDIDLEHPAILQAVDARTQEVSVPELYGQANQSRDLLLAMPSDAEVSFVNRIERERQAVVMNLPHPWLYVGGGVFDVIELYNESEIGQVERCFSTSKQLLTQLRVAAKEFLVIKIASSVSPEDHIAWTRMASLARTDQDYADPY